MAGKLPHALCGVCPLGYVAVAVPGCGPHDAELIVVGEAPGGTEEVEGIPFVGQSGKLLDAALAQAGLEFGSDLIYKTNVVACRPPGNREPTEEEISCCRPRLLQELAVVKGKKVLALGNTAHGAFGVPSSERNAIFEVDGRYVMPAWHPAFILRSPGDASEFLQQIRRAVQGPFEPNYVKWPEIRVIETASELSEQLDACPDDAWVAFDIETDQVQWYATEGSSPDIVLMLQLTWSMDFALILSDEMLYDTPGVIEILQHFFERVRTVGHNAKFDCVFLRSHFGLRIHQDFDTMLAHYTLDENTLHGLKFLARLEFGIPDYEDVTISQYLKTRNDRYSKVPFEELAKYGGMDVVTTLALHDLYETRLKVGGLYEDPFMSILMRAANDLTNVELRGMRVDHEQLKVISLDLEKRLEKIKAEIRELAGEPLLNPNSTQQVAEVLYDKLRLPIVKGRKIKPRSTAHEALMKLEGRHAIISPLLSWRRISKMKSSYVENLRYYIDVSGRVHGTFKIQGTEVSRLSISDPALQTIPRPDDYFGALIRSAFIAGTDRVLLMGDFSQAELRILACISKEPFLLQAYRDGRDLHSEVAIAMYGPNYTKAQRVVCKMFNFSYVYGGNEYSFASDQGLNIDVARQFVQNYNELMPVARKFKKDSLALARTQGYVETRLGRRRRFPLVVPDNVDEVRKACVHFQCASPASDITLLSGLKMEEKGAPVVLMVHDSILIDCPVDELEDTSVELKKTMLETASSYYPEVPWEVDIEWRQRWADMPENP